MAETDYLVIGHDFRTITIPQNKRLLGVVNDANVNVLHFRAPKYYGEVDLSGYTFRINYINPNGDEDTYEIEDLADSETEENTLEFTWTVGRVACAYEGDVEFAVRAYTVTNDVIDHEYHTLPYKLPVVPSVDVDGSTILTANPDALQELIDRIKQLRTEVTFGEGVDLETFLSVSNGTLSVHVDA